MITQNQKQIWNAIAPEWKKFKVKDEKQNPETVKFLKQQKGIVHIVRKRRNKK